MNLKVSIIGASGKLGQYMVQHALERGYEVVGVCREKSVKKLDRFAGRITIVPGATNDPEVIQRAVAGCDAVLVVLVPWGVHHYSSGTAGSAPRVLVRVAHHARWQGPILANVFVGSEGLRLARQTPSSRRHRRPGGGLPAGVRERHPFPILESNLTRRVDFALFMVEALQNDELIHEAPAIVGCRTPSALAHASASSRAQG
jgi:NADPH:quinone reductase-like Zn-dependent oxidoreductase